MSSRDRTHLLSATVCALLLAIPFVAVEVPPITDLPQQTAQIRLLREALGDAVNPYRVQWADPNKLGYLPLVLASIFVGPLAAGRLALVLIAGLWVAAIHALARDRCRHPATAAAASMFFLNHTLYWGFLNFLIGFPVFVLWLLWLCRRSRRPAALTEGPAIAALSLLLYSAHVLWLAAGLIFFLAEGLRHRWRLRRWLLRSVWILPALVAVAVWYPTFTAAGFESPTAWGHSFVERLHPGWILNSVFGGLHGTVEASLFAALLGWLLLGIVQSRAGVRSEEESPANRPDPWLAYAGLLFLVAAYALPSVHQHTIFFASRWLPVAAVLLVLAVPIPRLHPLLAAGFPFLLAASLSAATAAAWIGFEDEELDGLRPALAGLPPAPRLLGLDFVRTSERIRGFPYYHLYAWGQALHGGELNRTFANEASSLVVYRDLPCPYPWTDGLDWEAFKVRRSDVAYFDHILIHGDPGVQALFLEDQRLVPVTGLEGEKRWRLYRVRLAPEP